jgi:hypothetical protein
MRYSFSEEIAHRWFHEQGYFVDANIPIKHENGHWGDIDLLCYRPPSDPGPPSKLVVVECKAHMQADSVEPTTTQLRKILQLLNRSEGSVWPSRYEQKYRRLLQTMKPVLVIVYDHCEDTERKRIAAFPDHIRQLGSRELLGDLLLSVSKSESNNPIDSESSSRVDDLLLRALWALADRKEWVNIKEIEKRVKCGDYLGSPAAFDVE